MVFHLSEISMAVFRSARYRPSHSPVLFPEPVEGEASGSTSTGMPGTMFPEDPKGQAMNVPVL